MNKLFTKIVGAALGLTMAIGVGVAVASSRETVPAEAGTSSDVWKKITSDPVSGTSYLIIGDDNSKIFLANVATIDDASNFENVTPSNNQLTGDYDAKAWTFTKSGSDWYISRTLSNTTTYIGRSANSNGFTTATTQTNDVKNTISNSSGTFTIAGTGGRKLSYNSSSGKFRYFSSGTVYLYEKQAASTFTVTYDANGADTGAVPTDSTKYATDASVTVKGNIGSPALAKENHAFSGWTLNAAGTGTVYGPGDGQTATYTMGNANVTFYAKWVDTRTYYAVATSTEHLLLSGDTYVLQGESATITVSADAKWRIPASISVTGAGTEDENWSYSNGTLTILEVTSAVSVSANMEEAEISDISVEIDASETSFYLGHDFTHSTAVVTGIYDDAYLTEEDVTAGCTWSSPDMFTTGNSKTVTVTHTASGETDTYTISVSAKETSVGGIAKVTNVADLTVNSTVYLVCEGRSKQLSGINTSGSTHYGNGADYTTSIASATYPLTVVAGNSNGTIAFKDSSNKYLYWNSGNSLDSNATLSDKTSWTVTISDGNATILNAYDDGREIMWNVSATRFACYSGQTPTYDTNSGYNKVQIYKNYPAVTKDLIKIEATVKSGTYYIGNSVTVNDFNVTAYYDNNTTDNTVTATSLTNAALSSTSNTVTVNYTEGGITKSANVVVTAEAKTAALTSITWSQAGLTVFDGGELNFSTLGTVTAYYDDSTSGVKAIGSCVVGLYSEDSGVYTLESTITDGHEWDIESENGLYLGVAYTENAITQRAYSSAAITIVETINDVFEQVATYTWNKASSISVGDVVVMTGTKADGTAPHELSGCDGSIGNVSSFTTSPAGTYRLEVVDGADEGQVAFKTTNNKYLSSTTDKSLSLSDNVVASSSWTVSIDENQKAVVTNANSGNPLQYNPGSRFCVYASASQQKIVFYKGTAGYSPTGESIANTNAVAQKAVLDFAKAFLSATGSVCEMDGSSDLSTWSTTIKATYTSNRPAVAGDNQDHFDALIKYAYSAERNEEGLTPTGDVLQKALARYDWIIQHHDGLEDFLHNTSGRAEVANARVSFGFLNVIQGNNTAAIIIIVSLIGITAIGGYFFIRKRKEQ